MNGLAYSGAVLATAVGGFDPAPMIIMAAALGARLRHRHIMGASALLLAGTAAWGTALTLLVGPRLQSVGWWALVRHGAVAAWIELALGLVAGGYAVWRAVARRRSRGRDPEEKPPATNPWALYVTALVFVAIVVLDLPFDVHVAAAATQPLVSAVLGWIAWALISQLPLTLLVLLTVAGRQERFSRVTRRAWTALAPWVNLLVTALLGLAALVMLVDAGAFLGLGRFLIG